MATVEGLNLRGSRYYLRVLIPEDLQAHYGKPRVNPSLRTSDKAEAVRKGLRLRAEWLEEFETKRKALSPQALEVITPELLQVLAAGARRRVLQADQYRREGKDPTLRALSLVGLPLMRSPDGSIPLPERSPLEGLSDWELNVLTTLNATESKAAGRALAGLNLRTVLPLLQADALALGFTITEQTDGLPEALKAYLRSYRQAWQDASRMDAGELLSTDSHLPITQTPTAPPEAPMGVLGTPTAVPSPSKSHTLREIRDLWLKAAPKSRDATQASSRALGLAEECLGSPLFIQEVTRAHGNTFKAWLQEPARPFGPKTAQNHMMYVSSLLRFAAQELEVIQRNPWEKLSIEVPKKVTRIPWKDHELETLFSQPLHQSYALPPEDRKGGGPAAYWLPILGIYTGARMGELTQLLIPDITEVDGIPVIRITDEGEGQSLKSEAARRSIPIHSELIRLGLLDYAEEVRKADPKGSLWPLLNRNTASSWFSEYRKSFPGLEAKWLDFHSFRHTVRTRLAKAEVSEKTMEVIIGHEPSGSTGRKVYTHLDMEDLRKAIQKLSYGSIDLPRVYASPRLEKASRGRQKSYKGKTKS